MTKSIPNCKDIFNFLNSFILTLIFTNLFFFTESEAQNTKQADTEKANKILELSRKAVSKATKSDEVIRFSATLSGDYQPTKKEAALNKVTYSFEDKWEVELPNKLHLQRSVNYISNKELREIVINSDFTNVSLTPFVQGMSISIAIPAQTKKILDAEFSTSAKTKAFVNFLPIILSSAWNKDISFSFIGVAETKDGKADVIQGKMNDKSIWQLFFDQKNHLPLLMIQTLVNETTNEKTELKYFLSEYKEEKGLLVPHKIITQQDGEVTEDQEFKLLEINPTFKANTFEINK